MINKKIPLIILFLLSLAPVLAQRTLNFSVELGDKTVYVPFTEKNGMHYISAKELAEALGGSWYYNEETAKVEMKFPDSRLKFTGKSPFVVLTDRDGRDKSVYQMPVSALSLKEDIFIPMKYAGSYVSAASGRELKLDEKNRNIAAVGAAPAPVIKNVTPETKGGITPPVYAEVKKDKEKPAETSSTASRKGYDVSGIEMTAMLNGTMITVGAKRQISKPNCYILNDVCYLYLSGVHVDPDIAKGLKATGLVKSVGTRYVDNNMQLEFHLEPNHKGCEAFQDPATNDIIITIQNDILVNEEEPAAAVEKDKWKFDAVVIDAGHGGKDPGAIGKNGTREKDINLAIARKLGKMVEEKLDSVKVIYTRDDDTFVELYRRGKIANENGGKLFISIHCNSLGKKKSSVRGFEVYLLRPGRTQEAIEIAEFENSVIKYEENSDRYEELTDENFILVSMAHSAYMRYSEQFSDILNRRWIQNVGIPTRGVKQAGFYVLVGASMPGVLVEAGFLSNGSDEKYLNSAKGQNEIAEALFESVKEYKEFYETSLVFSE